MTHIRTPFTDTLTLWIINLFDKLQHNSIRFPVTDFNRCLIRNWKWIQINQYLAYVWHQIIIYWGKTSSGLRKNINNFLHLTKKRKNI